MLLKTISIILINLLLSSSNCQEYDTQIYANLLRQNSSLSNLYLPHLNDYIYYLDFVLNDSNVSFKCQNDINHLKQGLLTKQEFALNCECFFKNFKFKKAGVI